MSTRLKFGLSYLKANKGRTLLVLLALIIGLWGLATTVVSYAILRKDLNRNYNNTLPAHVTLKGPDFERLDLEKLRSRDEIAEAEYRGRYQARAEVEPGKWLPIVLYGIQTPSEMKIALVVENGTTRQVMPALGSMFLERDGRRVSRLKAGTQARVRLKGGVVREIEISGIAFDPGLAPSSMDHILYSYMDAETFQLLTGESVNKRLMIRFKEPENRAAITAKASTLVDELKQEGYRISEVTIPKPGEHPHQFQLNSILALEGGIGLLSFLVGIILVWQLMEAILVSQVRQMGIFKAIGAARSQITITYSTMVLLLGAVSVLITLPLAVVSGKAFAWFISSILNFDVLTKELPIQLIISLVAIGLLLPLLCSLPAILKATRISALEALSDYGVKDEACKSKFDLARLPRGLQLIIKNVLRRKARLAVTVATLALGVGVFSSGFNLRQSLIVFLEELDDSYRYDIQLSLGSPIEDSYAVQRFSQLPGAKSVEAWDGGTAMIYLGDAATTPQFNLVALPYDTRLMKWNMIRGNWLRGDNVLEMVINQAVLESFGTAEIGKFYTVEVDGKRLNVRLAGIAKQFALPVIYIDQKQFLQAMHRESKTYNLVFNASDGSVAAIRNLRMAIEKEIGSGKLNVLSVMSQADLIQALYDHLNIILVMVTAFALLVLITGALGMASAMGINIMERTREIGVLRAIGATPPIIYRIFFGEGMVVSLLAIITGLLVSIPISILLSSFFGQIILSHPLSFSWSWLGSGITILITLSFSLLSSRIPAKRTLSIPAREALAYE